MARSGWSTSNFLRCSSAIVTAVPFTMACWGKTSDTTHTQIMMGLLNSANDTDSCELGVIGGTKIGATAGDASAGVVALTSTSIAANTWLHACGVWSSATLRTSYLNGGGSGTETTSVTPVGLNRTSIGVEDRLTTALPFAPAGTGLLAEAAIWNVALTAADVASLALGIHPFLVRPDKLVAYWDILGYNSPETNRKSNTATMAIQGSLSQAAHPRIFYASKRVLNPRVGNTTMLGQAAM